RSDPGSGSSRHGPPVAEPLDGGPKRPPAPAGVPPVGSMTGVEGQSFHTSVVMSGTSGTAMSLPPPPAPPPPPGCCGEELEQPNEASSDNASAPQIDDRMGGILTRARVTA